MTSALIIDNSILTDNKSKARYLSCQTIKKHLPTEISKGYMTITCFHKNNKDKYIFLYGILIGVQFYSDLLIIVGLHPSGLNVNIHNSMKDVLLHDS